MRTVKRQEAMQVYRLVIYIIKRYYLEIIKFKGGV